MDYLQEGGLAITVASGAAKGAWGLGWLTEMAEQRPEFLSQVRVVYGTSVGALIASAVTRAALHGKVWPLHQAWEAMLELGRYGLSQELLADLIHQCLPDKEAHALVKQNQVELGACAMSTSTLKGRLFCTSEGLTADEIRRALLASAAIPGLMEPVWVVSEDETFIDGAAADFNPIGFLGFSRYLNHLQQVWRIDYDHGRTEQRNQVQVFVEPPSLSTRAAGAAINQISKQALGVSLPAATASMVARLIGTIVTEPGSQSRKLLDTYMPQDMRRTLKLSCWAFKPARALPLGGLDFDVDLLSRAYALGREAARILAQPATPALRRTTRKRL